MKFHRTENTIFRVIALNGNTNVHSLTFKKQFAMYGITGSSGQLVLDEEEGATMVVSISRGAMP
jgi:hypothetical protein